MEKSIPLTDCMPVTSDGAAWNQRSFVEIHVWPTATIRQCIVTCLVMEWSIHLTDCMPVTSEMAAQNQIGFVEMHVEPTASPM